MEDNKKWSSSTRINFAFGLNFWTYSSELEKGITASFLPWTTFNSLILDPFNVKLTNHYRTFNSWIHRILLQFFYKFVVNWIWKRRINLQKKAFLSPNKIDVCKFIPKLHFVSTDSLFVDWRALAIFLSKLKLKSKMSLLTYLLIQNRGITTIIFWRFEDFVQQIKMQHNPPSKIQ